MLHQIVGQVQGVLKNMAESPYTTACIGPNHATMLMSVTMSIIYTRLFFFARLSKCVTSTEWLGVR